MTIKTTPLCELQTAHDYFAGGRCEALEFSPTPQTAMLLDRQRMFFRRTSGGCVVLVEVDALSPTLDPIVPIAPGLRFDFAVRSNDPVFATYTALPDGAFPFHHLSNRRGAVSAAIPRLHPNARVDIETTASLSGNHLSVNLAAPGASASLEVLAEDDRTLASAQTPVTGGRAAANFDLTPFAPVPVTVRLNGATVSRVMSDRSLVAQAPFAVVSLTARVGVEELSLTDNTGRPRNPKLQILFGARTTIWRYTVVTRTNSALDHTTLLIEDQPPVAGVTPLHFNAALPKAPLPNGAQAVVIESSVPVPFLSRPRGGLRLSRRVGPDTAPLLNDLPNPPPATLSPASTPGRPVSEVFLYV